MHNYILQYHLCSKLTGSYLFKIEEPFYTSITLTVDPDSPPAYSRGPTILDRELEEC